MMHTHSEAKKHVSFIFVILNKYMPFNCSLITIVGICQMFGALLLQTYGYDFDPYMFMIAYIASLAHLFLSGLLTVRSESKIYRFIVAAIAAIAVVASACIVYYLKIEGLNSNVSLLLAVANVYSIIVLCMWIAVLVHNIARSFADRFRPLDPIEMDNSMINGI